MIYFDELPLDSEILKALEKLKINYVFQPIFQADGKTVFAREALMRPVGLTVTELIEEYTKAEKLHILEVATFFGAMQEYILRGYTEHICINSFPSEYFTLEEAKAFADYYGDPKGVGIIEILEYPYVSEYACSLKKLAAKEQDLQELVSKMSPDIIKLDRSLISDIDKDKKKQDNVKRLVLEFHKGGLQVVAEGVERKEEYEYLLGIGIDLYQGFYFARPA